VIAVPVATILSSIETTKGKSGTQIEIERELKALLDKRKLTSITETELEKLFEEAAMECALRDTVTKMRKAGKLQTIHPVKH
jgi:hypothetical protein